MDNENRKIEVIPQGDTIAILHGEARKQEYPVPFEINGNLMAAVEYLRSCKENLDNQDTFLQVFPDSHSIKFTIGKNSEYKNQVSGSMKKAAKLSKLGVNADKNYAPKELGKLLKQYKEYIHPEDFKVVGKLISFQGKVTTTIEDHSSQKGDVKKLLEKVVDSEVPPSFRLTIPVFNGYPEQTFVVELWGEATSNSVEFYLESVELLSLEDRISDEALKEVSDEFRDFGCPVMTC